MPDSLSVAAIQMTAPVSVDAVMRELRSEDVASKARSQFEIEVTAATDPLTLSRLVCAALDRVVLAERRSVVPERRSLLQFNLRPAAG